MIIMYPLWLTLLPLSALPFFVSISDKTAISNIKIFEQDSFSKKITFLCRFLMSLIIFLLIVIQIILGAFLSGLNGGLIYNTWPDMNGTFFPNDVLLLDLFTSESFYNTSIIQFLHRSTAYLLVILVMIINYLFIKEGVAIKNIILFDTALLIQILLGIVTLISGVEIKYASLHQLGSIFVLTTYILLIYKNSRGFLKR